MAKKLGKINENKLKWMLDLVGITTICDIVPLVDENRVFAKYGLIVLRKTRRIGLKKLYQVAKINNENIDTYSVGFQIGPRINAPSRMDHAGISYFLLREKNSEEALVLAEKLNRLNQKRQDELERVLKEAKAKIEKGNLHQKKVICVSGKNWPQGLVGLVAGKITEEFARPCFVFEEKDKVLKGSARSVDGFNLVEALEESKEVLEDFGGHAKAAGMTVANDRIEDLYNRLLMIADSKLKEKDLISKIYIDVKLELDDLKLSLVDDLKKLEPFGLGNHRPIFCLKGASVSNMRTVGKKDKHLKFKINDIDVIGFDWGFLKNDLKENQKIDIAFNLDEDSWDGRRKVQLKIIDIKLNGTQE